MIGERTMERFCAIVPSLNPDDRIIDVINGLKSRNFYRIIVINDGSKSKEYFDKISDSCDILTHYKNYGKGRAMKNALNYYMNTYSDKCTGVVFLDSDNQHDIDDICNCCKCSTENPGSLVLGVRNFNSKNVPFKSKYGNKITAAAFRLLCGITISDTQTGLRTMDNSVIPYFLDVEGERFEYETTMLLETKRHSIPIKEVEIKTVYYGNNETSHFNPLTDSFAIYKLLFRFSSASIASAVIDIGIYTLIVYLFLHFYIPQNSAILIATVSARIISSLFNYIINHKIVFNSTGSIKHSLIKYYILCVLQVAASYFGVFALVNYLKFSPVIAKVIVDFILFLISFKIQQKWVFRNKKITGV